MQYSIIQKKSKQELFELINELKAELFLLRFKNKTGQQDQTHKIKLVRRDIAKALTALKNIENDQNAAKTSSKKEVKSSKTKETKKQLKAPKETKEIKKPATKTTKTKTKDTTKDKGVK